jgi:hypothetical protein
MAEADERPGKGPRAQMLLRLSGAERVGLSLFSQGMHTGACLQPLQLGLGLSSEVCAQRGGGLCFPFQLLEGL